MCVRARACVRARNCMSGTEYFIFFSVMQLTTLHIRREGVDAMNVQTKRAIKKTGLHLLN